MKTMSLLVAAGLALSGCAQHRLTTPGPETGQAIVVDSNAFLLGVRQPRIPAKCPTKLLREVRVHQTFLHALATVATLGLWHPTRLEYRCAKVPNPGIGSMDEEVEDEEEESK